MLVYVIFNLTITLGYQDFGSVASEELCRDSS
ncbi:MAG: hypothetical protein ACI9LL_000774, partial [Porticoccus sp.]